MGDWHVGDPVGFGNDIGAPEVPYMSYVRRDDEKKEENNPTETNGPEFRRAKRLGEEALILERQGRYDEAMVFIDRALELNDEYSDNFNIKAMILDDTGCYEEALEYYDRALKISNHKTIRGNKAQCLYRIADERFTCHDLDGALDYVNQALALLPDDEQRSEYLLLKSVILNSLGRTVQAKKCRLLSQNRLDEIAELERADAESSDEIRICIAGTRYYKGLEPFHPGLVVELFEEPANDYDPDAIRVEIVGEKVGYVANSPNTLAYGVESASQINRLFKNKIEAEILSVEDGEVIARLIGVRRHD